MKNKVLIAAAVLIAAFLVGFIPQYVKANRLDNELQQSRQSLAGADLRDLAGLAYLQASQKNYGLAADTVSRFFNRVREVAAGRKAIEDLASARDKITAELAKGDPAAIGDLQELFLKTRQATAVAQ
jgi:hypothetical protein